MEVCGDRWLIAMLGLQRPLLFPFYYDVSVPVPRLMRYKSVT